VTFPESPIYLRRQIQVSNRAWVLGAVEAAIRVRAAVVRVGVGACYGCSPNTQADSDSGADQHLCHHPVVLSCHVVLFPCERGGCNPLQRLQHYAGLDLFIPNRYTVARYGRIRVRHASKRD
jgi:hypothetical protein